MRAQPAIVFAGELFEKEPALGQARLLLLDFFRGRQVTNIVLKASPQSVGYLCMRIVFKASTSTNAASHHCHYCSLPLAVMCSCRAPWQHLGCFVLNPLLGLRRFVQERSHS